MQCIIVILYKDSMNVSVEPAFKGLPLLQIYTLSIVQNYGGFGGQYIL